MKLTPLPAGARTARPWANGGGVTREVAIWPPDASIDHFDWRISIAEVNTNGPFSRFSEVDRVLTVLQGAMRLRIAGRPPVLLTGETEPYAFPGDVACEAEVIAPVVDLNVMTRRGLDVVVRRFEGRHVVVGAAVSLMVIVRPGVVGNHTLSTLDALKVEGTGKLQVDGAGWLIEFG